MNTLLALACLTSLGFCVEELPDLLRRQRLARERQAHDLEIVQARLALAIDAQWRAFGCARGMTDEELARTRRACAAKHPPPVGPSAIPMKTMAEASAALNEFGRRVGAPARPWVVNPRTIRPPRSPTAVTQPRAFSRRKLDTSELRELLAEACRGLDARREPEPVG